VKDCGYNNCKIFLTFDPGGVTVLTKSNTRYFNANEENMRKSDISYEECVAFHGHSCPGLLIGYRVGLAVGDRFFKGTAVDEELVAVVENDACCVDAIQLMTGCTFGKGNLIFKDYGKMVFTFYKRDIAQGIRIYADTSKIYSNDSRQRELMNQAQRTESEEAELQSLRAALMEQLHTQPAESFMTITAVHHILPPKARIFTNLVCSACGERVMESQIQSVNQTVWCQPCFAASREK
jgi:formylmethanofuran dehydrogenase subunit E